MSEARIECADHAGFLAGLDAGSVDLVLTDPPYGISIGREEIVFPRRSRGGKAMRKNFGEWDGTPPDYPTLAASFARVLRKGGTAVVWLGQWHISHLHAAMEAAGFGVLRLLVWQKTNPAPLLSKVAYMNTAREFAVCGVKGGGGTFNSSYDTGLYSFPNASNVPGGKKHPTQKPLALFTALVEKHSNAGDLVVDPFLGSGTTAEAAISTGRRFAGCDISADYVQVARDRLTDGGLL